MGILKSTKVLLLVQRCLCKSSKELKNTTMKYLNVAEKNDAAKRIAGILSKGNHTRREGLSQFNKIYEFNATVFGQPAQMTMTSVSGHLMGYDFVIAFKNWQRTSPLTLFDAPILKECQPGYLNIKKTLEREIRSCDGLIIWTDCDREGENIGFEIIDVCKNIKPNIRVFRAKFSEITDTSIFRAINNLGQPDKNSSDAVDVRQELDLRTGAAFTRLQTLRLQKVFPVALREKILSYGSCQFPTLGFVVERYKCIEDFVSEPFWRIKMSHKKDDLTVDYNWKRDRLFDKNACQAFVDICQEHIIASVENIESKPKNKWRPLPLDTVEFEKVASKKLRINAKDAMRIAEKLYSQGYISYPRTETNIFPTELNLRNLVEQQTNDHNWGPFAQRILNEGGPNPRQGRKSDQAHPPIHPIKYINTLSGNDKKVYEYIVRHFLACVSKDALGHETTVHADIANEKFVAKGLMILEKNYLDVYIYEKWNAKEIHNYQVNESFIPTELTMVESSTQPPNPLTEAELIALMDRHGIGTDATHAEHIEKIKYREYVGLENNMYFLPGVLGMGLVEGYNNMGLHISLAKPNLRSEFENDLKLICEGRKNADVVRREQIEKYRAVFKTVMEKMNEIDNSMGNRLNETPIQIVEDNIIRNEYKSVMKCSKCGNDMMLRTNQKSGGKFISCNAYPKCRNSLWFPLVVETVDVLDEECDTCGPTVKKLKIKFKQNLFPGNPNPAIFCVGGCDLNVLDAFEMSPRPVKQGTLNAFLQNPNPEESSRDGLSVNRTEGVLNNSVSNNRSNSISSSQNSSSNRSTQTRGNIPTQASQRAPNLNGNTRANSPVASSSNSPSVQNEQLQVLCQCGEEARLLRVRKEGETHGKLFYACKYGKNRGCNYFVWYKPEDLPLNKPLCLCDIPSALKTCFKNDVHKGRKFYCCSKSKEERCNFFIWFNEEFDNRNNDDNLNDDDGWRGGGSNEAGGSGTGGAGAGASCSSVLNTSATFSGASSWKKNTVGKCGGTTKNTTRPNPYAKARKKCGICRQEGHTRNKCPKKK